MLRPGLPSIRPGSLPSGIGGRFAAKPIELAIAVAIQALSSLRSTDASFDSPMDIRLLLVATPVLLAVGWAAFNIGRAAVGQLQLMLKRARA